MLCAACFGMLHRALQRALNVAGSRGCAADMSSLRASVEVIRVVERATTQAESVAEGKSNKKRGRKCAAQHGVGARALRLLRLQSCVSLRAWHRILSRLCALRNTGSISCF